MKKLGQVFTPQYIVDRILEEINFNNVLNKKILEPSFGEGVFLLEIIKRIIKYGKEMKLSDEEIIYQLENNIYGIEIDKKLYDNTYKNIQNLLLQYGYSNVKLHLYNIDALDFNETIQFDYIVGNPPYLRIHDLDDITRQKIKHFKFSSGSTDLYIVFFELCINLLSNNGKLGFITPNSFLKNTSQKEFRNYLIEKNLVSKLINFDSNKVFADADTYAIITILDKQKKSNQIMYVKNDTKVDLSSIKINLNQYSNKEWNFGNKKEIEFINKISLKEKLLSDNFNVQYGFATNADKIFIGKIKDTDKTTCKFNGYKIETDILIDVVKGSTFDGNISQKILFPYILKDNKYIAMEESYLKEKYPLAYKYLLDNKEKLEKRDLEKNIKWYEFARSQSINSFNKEKLILKHIISNDDVKVSIHKLSKDVAVYSGIYITAKNDNDLEVLKEVLESADFCTYCKIVGKDMSGGYKAISTKHIKAYKY